MKFRHGFMALLVVLLLLLLATFVFSCCRLISDFSSAGVYQVTPLHFSQTREEIHSEEA